MHHPQQKGPTKQAQNRPPRPATVLGQAHGPGNPSVSSRHPPLLRPSSLPSPAFSSYSIFHPCWGFSFSGDSIHFVLLKVAQFLLLPWLFHPDPWPALKPTAQATGAVTDLPAAAPPVSPRPTGSSRRPAVRGVYEERHTQESVVCVCCSSLGQTPTQQYNTKMFPLSPLNAASTATPPDHHSGLTGNSHSTLALPRQMPDKLYMEMSDLHVSELLTGHTRKPLTLGKRTAARSPTNSGNKRNCLDFNSYVPMTFHTWKPNSKAGLRADVHNRCTRHYINE